MRVWLVVLAACGGCFTTGTGDDGGGWTGPNGDPVHGCTADSQCGGGQGCAPDGECYASTSLRKVSVTWTLRGQPASDATCSAARDLEIEFTGSTDELGFAPVPCRAGKFTVLKLPTWLTRVSLGRDANTGIGASFDAAGLAAIDLPY